MHQAYISQKVLNGIKINYSDNKIKNKDIIHILPNSIQETESFNFPKHGAVYS